MQIRFFLLCFVTKARMWRFGVVFDSPFYFGARVAGAGDRGVGLCLFERAVGINLIGVDNEKMFSDVQSP